MKINKILSLALLTMLMLIITMFGASATLDDSIFYQPYSGDLNDSTGYTSAGGTALYNLADSANDQWGSSDGTRNGGQTGTTFDGVDDSIRIDKPILNDKSFSIYVNFNINESKFGHIFRSIFDSGDNIRLFVATNTGLQLDATPGEVCNAYCYFADGNDCLFTNNGTHTKVYTNGVLKNTYTGCDFEGFINNTDFLIGQSIQGDINNLTFFDWELSSDDAQEIYTKNKPETRSSYYNTDGLVAGYDFRLNQDSSDLTGDYDGNDTNVNYIGTGAVFDGTSSWIDLDDSLIDTTTNLSVCIKNVQFNILGNSERIISSDNSNRLYIYKDSSNRLIYYKYLKTIGTDINFIELNKKYNICITHNNNTLNESLYVNGEYIVGGISTYNGAPLVGLNIGSYSDGIMDFFNGTMGEVMIYNRTLTETEILKLNNSGSFVNDKEGKTNSAISFNREGIKTSFRFNDANVSESSFSIWAKLANTTHPQMLMGTQGAPLWGGGAQRLIVYPNMTYIEYDIANRTDSAKKLLAYNTGITENEWIHIVTTLNDTDMCIYSNGQLSNCTSRDGFEVYDFNNLNIGNELSGLRYPVNGTLDEVRIYDRALTQQEITQLAYGMIVYSNISLITEYNTNFNVYVNYTDYGSNSNIICGIDTNSSGLSCSNTTANVSSCVLNGNVNEYIALTPFCYDDDSTKTEGDSGSVYVDNVSPIITLNTPVDSSVYLNVTPVSFDIDFADNNLYGFNMTCLNDDLTTAYTIQNTSLNGLSSYNYLDSQLFTTGVKNCTVLVADGHTSSSIDIDVKQVEQFLGFIGYDKLLFNDEVELIYLGDNLEELTYDKHKDRISPKFKVKKDTTEIKYKLKFNGKSQLIQTEYLGHTVILPDGDLSRGYWYDLETEDNDMILSYDIEQKKNEVIYTITLNNNFTGTLITDSIGQLNTITENFSFETIPAQSIIINSTESFGGAVANVDIRLNNGSITYYNNTNYQVVNTTCDATISVSDSNYINSYEYTSTGCSFEDTYNLEFYQAILTVNSYSNGSTTLIPNSAITINDSVVSNTTTAATGSKLFYVNTGTISYKATHPTHTNPEMDNINVIYNSNNMVNLISNYDGSLTITVYDADTLDLITSENITIESTHAVLGTESTINTDNTTGQVSITPHAGSTIFTFYGDNYSTNTYNYTLPITFPATDSLNLYLTNTALADNTVIFTIKNSITSALIEGVRFVTKQNINDSWVVVSDKITDITGRTQYAFVEDGQYQFTLSKTGFVTKIFELNPILFTAYGVSLTPNVIIEESIQDLGIYADFTPKVYTLNDTGVLTFTINNPYGSLTNYSLSTTYGADVDTYIGTNATGGVLTHTYNLSNDSINYFVVRYNYLSENTGYKSFTYPYKIEGAIEGATIDNIKDNTFGMGMFERVLIVVILALIVAGITSLVAGAVSGGATGLIVLCIFSYIGFISWWFSWASLIVGFVLVLKGRSQ